MDERIVGAGATRLAARDWPGGDPPLVALHGLASNARWWDLVAGRLSPVNRVVALDLRGHGLSDRPDTGYTLSEVAADVAAALDELRVADHVVVGHSWGASVALRHAARATVLGVVCVDGGVGDLRGVFGGTWEEAAPLMTPPAFAGITVEAVRSWAASGVLAEGSDGATGAEILLGNFEDAGDGHLRPRLSLDRHMQIARDLFESQSAALLEAVRCPVLMIPASEPAERSAPRQAAVDAALTILGDRGTVAWINGGHDLPVQRPAEVAAAIRAWLDRVLPSPQPRTTS